MPSLNVELEPGKTVHVKLVKSAYITQEFDYTVPSSPATVTKTMVLEMGILSVTTTPTGATVKVVGGETKKSPCTFSLAPKLHTVEVSKPGYDTITDTVSIIAGVTISRSYTLTLSKGTLSVSTTPTGATVKVGTETKTSPCNFTLASGTYTVTVSKTGYDTFTDTGVVIAAGETTTKSYILTPSKLTITFKTLKEDTTELTGVSVYIDGALEGTT